MSLPHNANRDVLQGTQAQIQAGQLAAATTRLEQMLAETYEEAADYALQRYFATYLLTVAHEQGSIAGGAALLGIGFILLLHTRFGVSLEWMESWWPVAIVAFGAYLIIRARSDGGSSRSTSADE